MFCARHGGPWTPPRTTDANLDSVFVKTTLLYFHSAIPSNVRFLSHLRISKDFRANLENSSLSEYLASVLLVLA